MTRRKRRRAWLRLRCAERVDPGEDTNTMRRAITPVPGGAALCQRMFTRIGCAGPPPAFRVEFYPYSSLVLTIRRRDEQMIVRFSDLLAACSAGGAGGSGGAVAVQKFIVVAREEHWWRRITLTPNLIRRVSACRRCGEGGCARRRFMRRDSSSTSTDFSTI